MRVVDVRVADVPISRFAPPVGSSTGLRTTVVALVSDVRRGGRPIVGYGFASVGRAPVGALIRDRFADRLLAAVARPDVAFDPFAVWPLLMAGGLDDLRVRAERQRERTDRHRVHEPMIT